MRNSRKKTYGVYGLVEWYCSIPCGTARVDIPFTGGSVSGNGTVPAQYTTEDPFVQVVIEHSEYYRRGRIVLISDIEGSGRFKISDPSNNPAPASPAAPVEETEDKGDTDDGEDTDEGENAPEAAPVDESTASVTKVEVASLDEAKEYLNTNFGIVKSNLRSRTAIISHAEEHGIEFVGI